MLYLQYIQKLKTWNTSFETKLFVLFIKIEYQVSSNDNIDWYCTTFMYMIFSTNKYAQTF